MNYIYSFLSAFCVACILIGCLYIICPEGKLSKPIKYIFSLIFIVIIISCSKIPFFSKQIDLNTPDINTSTYDELQISSAKYVYAYTLRSQKINFSEITVCTDKLEDGSIVISKVIIFSDCEKEKILNALGGLKETREVEIINE